MTYPDKGKVATLKIIPLYFIEDYNFKTKIEIRIEYAYDGVVHV